MTLKIETVILQSLINDDEYMRKVIPFLKKEYFSETIEAKIFDIIIKFVNEYNNIPNKDAIVIALQNDKNLSDEQYNDTTSYVLSLETNQGHNKEWLLKETEKFCKDKALYNAILNSISIIDGRNKSLSTDGIPQLLQDALAVCFDNNVGHDYIENSDSRYDFYHRVESRIPFDLDYFNKITNGGLPNKTLNVVLAGTGVGKSLFMCHVAASVLSQGKNVLYITMEMAEERIAERIDANLMNITLDQLKDLPKQIFSNRIDKIKDKTTGKLIIKEYPTAGAHTGHFKSLLNELQLKRQFKPDMIIVDYLNICASSRFRAGAAINSYTLVKSIAEELRGMAVEENVPILSATQTTRGGYGNTDVELTDTSESFGLPATVDFMFALIATEELDQLNQLMVKQLKNRYNDPTQNKRFVIGVDRARMKLYDLEITAQKNISDSGLNIKEDALDTLDVVSSFFNKKKDFSGFKL
ncbi:MAG: DNA primase [Proteobacteria bacterium]|nr:DNA primase [Pseudomonadota bacterium]NBP15754.1 DNA primase [bacterium]